AMRFLGALMVFAACHIGGGEPMTPDGASDGSRGSDGGDQPGLGMFVAWHANPHLPGVVSDKITVSDATFQLDHFQVIGDAGVDARTTHSRYFLTWDGTGGPQQETFPLAPVGVYSKLALVMMSGNLGDQSYEIHGTFTDSGMAAKQFE